MIFVDSNVPMYLVGADHPNKVAAERLVRRSLVGGERLVTDAEVLQEILHRFSAIRRHDAIQPAFDVLLGVVDEVFPISFADVERAKSILLERPRLSARDSLHIAVMRSAGVRLILSFDTGLDGLPDVERVTG